MKRIIISLVIALTVVSATAQKVNVAAAADLRYAMDEIIVVYKKNNPKTDIKVTYGSSGTAYQQIINGAPYDIYFSADIMYPQKLAEQGLTATKPKLYAIGFLVLWSSQIDVLSGMNVLNNPKIQKIAIANPEHAPYGKRAQESLQYYKLYDKLKDKIILGENISQTAQYVQTGNAEVGILALSLAMSPAMKNQGKYFLIDSKSYSPLEQAYVIIKRAAMNTETYKFARFVASPVAREIFKKYGFKLPNETTKS
jgi:molybdate transport system substrate-binding protein